MLFFNSQLLSSFQIIISHNQIKITYPDYVIFDTDFLTLSENQSYTKRTLKSGGVHVLTLGGPVGSN
jgi:hypothetical protein